MSEIDTGEDDFSSSEWVSDNRISEKGVKAIGTNQIGDLRNLLLFKPCDVDMLRLIVGDALQFKAGNAKLNAAREFPPSSRGLGRETVG